MKRAEPEEPNGSNEQGIEAKHRKLSNEQITPAPQTTSLQVNEPQSNGNVDSSRDSNAVPSNEGMDVDKDHDKDQANQVAIKSENGKLEEPNAPFASGLISNSNTPTPQEDRNQKQKHAMEFLYKVRLHYAKTPIVYNNFLEIMKDFKSGVIDTPIVITRVKELFKGNGWLIHEFNAFLPPGFRIDTEGTREDANQNEATYISPAAPPSPTPSVPAPTSPSPTSPTPLTPIAIAPPSSINPQTDLEHARNYVRKIKNRFALQPNIYKTFLEILHSYYQGNHTINDVLDEVADLFQNHHDLLEEFKHFLPKQLNENQTYASAFQQNKKQPKPKTVKPKTEKPPTAPVVEKKVEERRTKPKPDGLEKEARELRQLEREVRDIERPHLPDRRRTKQEPTNRPLIRRVTKDEAILGRRIRKFKGVEHVYQKEDLFNELKQNLPISIYREFLRVMSLYSQDIVGKEELNGMVKDLLSNFSELLDKFRYFLGDMEKKEGEGKQEGMDQGLKNYVDHLKEEEEEDERYELDTMLQLNNSAMRALENILEKSEMTNTTPDIESLDILHVRTIEKMYGERAPEVVESLYNHPSATLPVVLKRLRNQGWTQVKLEMQKQALPALPPQPVEKAIQPAETQQNKHASDLPTVAPTLAVQS